MATTDTEKVSSGEVCSIEVAKSLNIYDTTNDNSYYLNEYSDVKTYNDTKDNLNNANIYKLCETTNSTGSTAAPLCVLQSNAGFGFTKKRSPGSLSYDTCTTAECPDGFTVDPNNDNSCIKPKKNNMTLMSTVVDERWYDWFVIPDYHLGNKFVRVGNTNYAPCKKGSIPSYETDPVDGLKKSFNSTAEDEVDKCVEKAKYFGGKYFNSETHCPLAWVYRAGATKKDLKRIYDDLLNQIDETGRGNEHLDNLKLNVDNIIHDKIYRPIIDYGFDDYVGHSQSDEAKAACSIIDPSLQKEALNICKIIRDVGKDSYIERLMNENQEDSAIANQKYKRALQACDTVFCNDESAEKVCFPEVRKLGFLNTRITGEAPPNVIDPEAEKAKVTTIFIIVVVIIVIGFFCAIAGIYFGPSIYRISVSIKDFLLRRYPYLMSWFVGSSLFPVRVNRDKA